MNKVLAAIIILAAFLPNSFEYGLQVPFKEVGLPIFYVIAALLIMTKLPTLVSGFEVLPTAALFLVYSFLHALCTFQLLTGNGLLGFIKGFVPPLMLVLVLGKWQGLPSFDKLFKSLWIYLLPFVVYVLFSCFLYSWVVAYGFFSWGGTRVDSGIPGINRAALPFGGPDVLGDLLILLFPIALMTFLESRKLSRASMILMSEIVLLILLTFSRGTYLMIGFMYVVLLVLTKRRGVALMLPAALLVIGLSLDLGSSRTFHFYEIEADINGYSNSDSLRAATYLNAWNHIKKDPIGTGIGADFLRYGLQSEQEGRLELTTLDGRLTLTQPHSAWLSMLVEFGWPGGLLLLLLFISILRQLQRAVRLSKIMGDGQANFFRAMQVSVISYALIMMISDALLFDFRFAVLLWTTLGLFVAYSLQYQKSLLGVVIEDRPQIEPATQVGAYQERLRAG